MPKTKPVTPKKKLAQPKSATPKKGRTTQPTVPQIASPFQELWQLCGTSNETEQVWQTRPSPSSSTQVGIASEYAASKPPLSPAVNNAPPCLAETAQGIYQRMWGAWQQVSEHIARQVAEANEQSAPSDLADFLQTRALDCLTKNVCAGKERAASGAQTVDGASDTPAENAALERISTSLGVWQVSLAVEESDGSRRDFPLLLIPQDLCEAVTHTDCAQLPIQALPGAASREWVVLGGQELFPIRHAFLVHACDLLVRPFGVVGSKIEYNIDKRQLIYIVRASDVDSSSVYSFLWALSRAERGNKEPKDHTRKADADANCNASTSSQALSCSERGQPTELSDAKSNASSGSKKRSRAGTDATKRRDALCPITLTKPALQAAHLCPLRLGQPIYSWIMDRLAMESTRNGRYDLTAWNSFTCWDINGPTNLLAVQPALNVRECWFLLPQVHHDQPYKHTIFPPICTFTTSFWNKPEEDHDKYYTFVYLHNELLFADSQHFDIKLSNCAHKNFTGIKPVFFGAPRNDKRRKIVHSPTRVSVAANQLSSAPAMPVCGSTNGPPNVDCPTQPPASAKPISLGRPRTVLNTVPVIRQLRPTAASSYWPEGVDWPPPTAHDATTISRLLQYHRSLGVLCFDSLSNADLRILIDGLPPHTSMQPQDGANGGNMDFDAVQGGGGDAGSRGSDAGPRGGDAGSRGGDAGSRGSDAGSHGGDAGSYGDAGSHRTGDDGGNGGRMGSTLDRGGGDTGTCSGVGAASGVNINSDKRSANGQRGGRLGPASNSDLGTVFLLSVMLLASRYAADDEGQDTLP